MCSHLAIVAGKPALAGISTGYEGSTAQKKSQHNKMGIIKKNSLQG